MGRKAPSTDSAEIDNVYVRAAADRLRSDPNDPDALVAVGAWLLAHGQAEKALGCFHRITSRDPKYPASGGSRRKHSRPSGTRETRSSAVGAGRTGAPDPTGSDDWGDGRQNLFQDG